MKWRALVLLLSGLAVIYIAVLSQDTPYLHPKIIQTSNHPPLFTYKPDELVISTIGSYIYLTAFKFEALKSRGSLVGTGKLRLGVQGYIKQVRKPISTLLTGKNSLETDGWTPCFEHVLKGPISQISTRNNHITDKKQTQFAVLYHQVDNDNSYHYVRIYYTNDEDLFEYKDIKLPGTTWVDAISLEKDSLIFSRNPDEYEFHIMSLPSTISNPPHHTLTTALGNYHIEKGRPVQEWSQPYSTEQCSTLFSRLYSSVNETYRVFTLNVHKTATTFYVNITIADNTTILNNEKTPVSVWIQREKGESDYPVYSDESIDYVGFSDMSYQNTHQQHQQQSSRVSMPKLHSTVSAEAKTIVFPYIKNKFITLDFTDRIDVLSRIDSEKDRLYTNDGKKTIIPEYYYWQGYETVDAEIMGIQLNEKGDNLALWTEFNYIYIYGRGKKHTKNKGKNKNNEEGESSLLGKIDTWFSYLLSEMSEEEKDLRTQYFPAPWRVEMAVSPIRDDYGGSKVVGAVHFWEDQDNETKYLFVALRNGNVNSYRIDEHESLKSADFWTFASERWDMLFAMCMVITIFVYNENQRP